MRLLPVDPPQGVNGRESLRQRITGILRVWKWDCTPILPTYGRVREIGGIGWARIAVISRSFELHGVGDSTGAAARLPCVTSPLLRYLGKEL